MDLKNRVLVGESGINSSADVQRLARCGAKAILVGESLLKEKTIAEKISELLGS
jgi:indole-3-glycerol phosphate synthase